MRRYIMNIFSGKHIPALFVILLQVFAGMGVYAKPALVTSPQSYATAGKIGSNADRFLSVRDYAHMEFNRFFSVISYTAGVSARDGNFLGAGMMQGKRLDTDMAKIGIAAKLGPLYTALYYGGNTWNSVGYLTGTSTIFDYSEQKENGKTIRVYDQYPQLSDGIRDFNNYNEAALLIGIADMGVRLSCAFNLQSLDINEDFKVTGGDEVFTGNYKNFTNQFGHINPGIAWGMTKNIIPGIGLKPEVRVELDFFRNYVAHEKYVSAFGGDTQGRYVANSKNEFTLDITAVLGGFSLYSKNNFNLGTDIEYRFQLNDFPYDNEYSWVVNGGHHSDANAKIQSQTLPSGFKWDNKGIVTEYSDIRHLITPSLSASWRGDTIILSSGFRVEVLFNENKTADMKIKSNPDGTPVSDGALIKQGATITENIFAFEPQLDLGMQWAVVPDIFFINAGGRLSFSRPYWYTQQETTYNEGNKGNVKRLVRNTSGRAESDSAKTYLYLGVTLNLFSHVGFQAVCGIGDGANTINTFNVSANGLFSFAHLLLTLQF